MNFEKIVYNHKDEIVKTFQELLQIPSVLDESDASVGEEKILPGLGVLFELLWEKADTTTKETIVSSIAKAL